MSPTVAIIGGTIWGNRGAEAMLVTSIGKVREQYADANIVVFSYRPTKDRQLIQDQSITVLDSRPQALVFGHFPFSLLAGLFRLVGIRLPGGMLPPSIRTLRDCDVLMDISGISFADGREKYLPFNVLIILPAMLLGVPVMKMAQANGSFENPLNRLVSRLFLRRCRQVYARGKQTAEFLTALPLTADKWQLSADIAFLYQPEYSLSDENSQRIADLEAQLKQVQESGQVIVGLSPSSLVYEKSTAKGKDYVGQFVALISKLDPAYHFALLPNATRESSDKARNNDIVVINAIMQRVKTDLPPETADRVHAADFDLNTAGSRRLIALCDFVVTSRFHGMISCLSLGVPVVVIGWSHKYAEVLASFDMERFAIDFDDPQLDVKALVEDLLAHKADLHDQIESTLVEIQALSQKQFSDVTALLR